MSKLVSRCLAWLSVTSLFVNVGCSSESDSSDNNTNGSSDGGENGSANGGEGGSSDGGENGSDGGGDGSSDGGENGSDGGESGSSDAGIQPGGELSCLAILDCLYACEDPDGPCPDQCVTDGSMDGQTKIVSLAECIQAEECTEADCLTNQCGTELQDCVDSSAPVIEGTPLEEDPPLGSIPDDLIGIWSLTRYGDTDRLTFNSDGTGSYYAGVATNSYGDCLSFSSTTISGPTVITDDRITVYGNDVVNVTKICSDPQGLTEQGDPIIQEFPWGRVDATSIWVVGASCAAAHAGEPESSVLGYCKIVLTRE